MSEARTIALALRGKPYGDGYLCCCPLPTHGKGRGDRTPSLLVKDGDRATLFKCFGGCDARDILAEMRARGLDNGPRENGSKVFAQIAQKPDHTPSPEALDIWGKTRPITPDTLAAAYLRARGITIDAPPSLRAGSNALVAGVRAPDGNIIAVQRTLIDPSGKRKAQVDLARKTFGALGWGAVRLAEPAGTLGIAEGTEKALAATQLFHVPCWASLGAARMHRVWIPDTVRTLHIFADNDDAGKLAAERTAHANRHRKVLLRFPPEQFKDWDDVLPAGHQPIDERGAA